MRPDSPKEALQEMFNLPRGMMLPDWYDTGKTASWVGDSM